MRWDRALIVVGCFFAILLTDCEVDEKIGCIGVVFLPGSSPCRDSVDFTIDEFPLGEQWLLLDSIKEYNFKLFNPSGDSISFYVTYDTETYNRKPYSTYPYKSTSGNSCYDGLKCTLLFSYKSRYVNYSKIGNSSSNFNVRIQTDRDINKNIYDRTPQNWNEHLLLNFNNISTFKYVPNGQKYGYDDYTIIPFKTFGKKTYQNVIHVYNFDNVFHQETEVISIFFTPSHGLLAVILDTGEMWAVR